jgi:hypothetical protein
MHLSENKKLKEIVISIIEKTENGKAVWDIPEDNKHKSYNTEYVIHLFSGSILIEEKIYGGSHYYVLTVYGVDKEIVDTVTEISYFRESQSEDCKLLERLYTASGNSYSIDNCKLAKIIKEIDNSNIIGHAPHGI